MQTCTSFILLLLLAYSSFAQSTSPKLNTIDISPQEKIIETKQDQVSNHTLTDTSKIASPHPFQTPIKLTMEDMRSFSSVGSPSIAPNGKYVLYTFSKPASRVQHIFRIHIESGENIQLTAGEFSNNSPKWSPNGLQIAFLTNKDEGGRSQQLWIMDTNGQNLKKITAEPSGVSNLQWSSDGLKIGFTTMERSKGSELVVIVDDVQPNEFLSWIDLKSDEIKKVNKEPLSGIEFSWSPDGKNMVVSAQKNPGFYGRFESDLFLFDLQNGQVKNLVTRPGMERLPKWSPDGKHIAFLSNYGEPGGLLPNIGPAIIEVKTGKITEIGKNFDAGGFFEGPTRLEWGPNSRYLYYNVNYKGNEHIIRADTHRGEVDVYSDGPYTYGAISLATEVESIAFVVSNFNEPYDIYYSNLSQFNPVRLTSTNTHIKKLAFPAAEMVSWTSKDGTEISGLLVKPPGFNPNNKYPLLISLHGGPASSIGIGFPSFDFFNPFRDELLAAEGIVVLLPNFRGSGGFGLQFRSDIKKNWGLLPYQDLMAGLDFLIDKGFIDEERLGIMGWSYGGYLTAYAITQTNRFKAAAVGAGISNLISHFGTLPEQMIEYLEGKPWEAEARMNYINSSPMMFANQISTPTLLIHGENDTAVSISQAEELYSALKTLGVESTFLRYPGQGHSFFNREVQEDSFQRVLDWFRLKLDLQ